MATNAYGEIYDTDNTVSGTAGNDKIVVGNGAGTDYAFGGAGNDTFLIKAQVVLNQPDAGKVDIVLYDFEGASGWYANGNDFIAFTGFGAGSSFTFNQTLGNNGVAAGAPGAPQVYYYYTLHDTTSNIDLNILVGSMNHKLLGQGDFNFY